MLRSSDRLTYTSMSGRLYLSLWNRGRISCYPRSRMGVLAGCCVSARAAYRCERPYFAIES
jgi:hypothetical protein